MGTPPADAAEAHAAQEDALCVFWSLRQAAGLLETGLMPALPTQAPGLFRGTRWEVPETGPWPGKASQATNIMKPTKRRVDGSAAAADGAAIVPDAQQIAAPPDSPVPSTIPTTATAAVAGETTNMATAEEEALGVDATCFSRHRKGTRMDSCHLPSSSSRESLCEPVACVQLPLLI